MTVKLKLYPPCPSGLDAALGELHPIPKPWPDGEPVVIQIPRVGSSTVFGFLKDAKVRFKVLEEGAAREWSPSRRDWIESVWDDG